MKIVRHVCACVLITVFGMGMGSPARGQAGPYLASVWDSAINIPPGGYRAPKAIELHGKINITTTPWTTIDAVTFNGTQDSQHWKINGTVLRRVSIIGQIGVGLVAKDSVFEGCTFEKTGGWFVSMWGSNWHFDNCIFTEKFMSPHISVGDYSIHAVHSTFYDVKLPDIGLKGDPGSYLQGKNLNFVACRFVRCNVPESFLAATGSCVFEDCVFPSKREKWPETMSAVSVTAMITGLSDPPASYMNGPVSVQFAEAPSNAGAGSTLGHTESGGEITLNNYSPPLQFVNLGSVPKKSSEIVSSAGDPDDGFSKPPAGPVGGNTVEVHSFDDLVSGLPQGISLIAEGQPDPGGIGNANKWLSDHFAGANAVMALQYGSGQATTESGAVFRVVGSDEPVVWRGTAIAGRAISLFPAETTEPLSHLSHGAQMNVRGVIKQVGIQARGGALVLVVTIANASLQ